jgi:hypothetical protein
MANTAPVTFVSVCNFSMLIPNGAGHKLIDQLSCNIRFIGHSLVVIYVQYWLIISSITVGNSLVIICWWY